MPRQLTSQEEDIMKAGDIVKYKTPYVLIDELMTMGERVLGKPL